MCTYIHIHMCTYIHIQMLVLDGCVFSKKHGAMFVFVCVFIYTYRCYDVFWTPKGISYRPLTIGGA